jgi:hypothetical protein
MTFKRGPQNTGTRDRPAEVHTEESAHWAWPLAFADRACCCTARPKVVAVLPPTATRPHQVDLLLCGHHYRAAAAALADKGAAVYDKTGALIPSATDTPELVPAGAA